MISRRSFPGTALAAATLASGITSIANFAPLRARAAAIRPGIFSGGQSQAGQGGTAPARTGPADTDSAARLPDRLFMFQTVGGLSGSIIEGRLRSGPKQAAATNRLVKSNYVGFAPYRETPRTTLNAATPFLFALTSRLDARGLIPNGLFGFTTWEGASPLNSFLPPGDPDYGIGPNGSIDPNAPTNFANLVAAIERYAELTRAAGFEPYVPLIRFEHGEGRVYPRGERDLEAEKAHYVAAHARMTATLAAEVRRVTGQAIDPIFLLGGWGGGDISTGLNDVPHSAVLQLVANHPERYVGPTSSAYAAPFYQDAGPSSLVHPGFLGRVIVGEAQAHVADLCLDAGLVPNASGFSALRCTGVTRAAIGAPAFDLTYALPPRAAAGGLELVVDDLLPATPNHGFEYQGADRNRTFVVAVLVVAPNTVRVVLNRPPTDPQAQIVYGFLPRDSTFEDGKWNYRGNLACGNDAPFFYGPILAAPPYDIALPPTQRYVAVQQRMPLPMDGTGPVIGPR